MTHWRLSAEADEDLVAVFIQGCDLFGVRPASHYVDALYAVFPLLAANPEMARLRTEFEPPFRIFRFKAHLIVYEEAEEEVLILRIRHGHEDWQADPRGPSRDEDQTR
ncbi:type II toxin-antitoxin system RelE/ParE family toxin [Brevundimonas sp.]|uniref:type II toxin-antitoxin system RelE/ParE family toxin n=1 Tax=Brevundimonas sp. TaxID=1871086 RepID=UPI003F70939B